LTIQQCRYILKIAESGSFSEAAKQLYVAQSSLSVSVKSLEQELNIRVFERSGNGVYLTDEGAEFARYARQIVMQSDFVKERYEADNVHKRLCVATQHYDFVADIFGKLLGEITDLQYRFALREMKTYDVISETENAFSDIGIIAVKSSDSGIMERYLSRRGLSFTPVLKAMPHVFMRKKHPLAACTQISAAQLRDYPYVCYDQGEHEVSFFAEELETQCGGRRVEISDRATLMNVLLTTDCCTIGTGIMPSRLNKGRIVSVPYESEDHYRIGYILRTDRSISTLTERFIDMLCRSAGKLACTAEQEDGRTE